MGFKRDKATKSVSGAKHYIDKIEEEMTRGKYIRLGTVSKIING